MSKQMITEKVSPLRRGNAKDISDFLSLPRKHTNSTRYERVSNSHSLIRELLKIPTLQCQSTITDDNFGYSEDYFFYANEREQYAIKINLRCCDQWQTYSRSIYNPSTLLDYNKLVNQCNNELPVDYKKCILDTITSIMKISQPDYTFYVDGDSDDFIFSIENNQKFSKLTLEVCAFNLK